MLRQFLTLAIVLAAFCTDAFAGPDQWIEVRSDHFSVVTDTNEKEARHIADQFERMRWMFHTLFPKTNVDPVAPIQVIAAKNSKVFQTLEPEAYLSRGALHLAGLFQSTPDTNYVLLRLDAEFKHPFASVYHEYTHLQFSPEAGSIPLWLNEGLAEFIQNTEILNKQVILGEPSPDDILYLRQNRLIPLPVLFQVDHNSPYYHEEEKGSVFYSESWALTHMLEVGDREKGTNRVGDYVKLISQHEDSVSAAEKAFGDLKQLQNALEYYIRASTYKEFILSSAAAPIDESTYRVRTLSPPDADAIRAKFLVGVQRVKDAQALVDEALKADPNNALACEAKATLEYHENHMEEARDWYGKAVKLSSNNFFAYFNFANLSMTQSDPVENPEIESSLRKSVELNPRFYPASDLLSSILASKDRIADAIAVMQASVTNSVASRDAAMARRKIAQLEQMQKERAQFARSATEATSSSGVIDIVPSGSGSPVRAVVRTGDTIVVAEPEPKHPAEPASGPKHQLEGVLRGVVCSYPSVMDFHVEGAKKTIALYSNNYFKLDVTAIGFTPSGSMQPCHDFEGMKARVQYAESSDKTVDGQVVSIELRK
jgi:tetratricopeptide (TPR) repeat protein